MRGSWDVLQRMEQTIREHTHRERGDCHRRSSLVKTRYSIFVMKCKFEETLRRRFERALESFVHQHGAFCSQLQCMCWFSWVPQDGVHEPTVRCALRSCLKLSSKSIVIIVGANNSDVPVSARSTRPTLRHRMDSTSPTCMVTVQQGSTD